MAKITPLARPCVGQITPYEAGKPISEVQREFGLTDVIKLASNENPLGPSPKAIEAVRNALDTIHLYPDGGGYYLKHKLSERFGVTADQIVLGNGSAEIVELVTESFINEGDEAIIGRQAFFKYKIAVQIMNGTVVWAEMPGLRQDPSAIVSKLSARTKVIFIANPNNPTGALMGQSATAWLMERIPENVVVVFDEAYYDYRGDSDYPDTMKYLNEGRNVIIMRTFSKSYGLAGFRIGYAFTQPDIAQAMNTVREAFNVNSLAQAAAIGALDDDEFLEMGIRINNAGKKLFYAECDRLGLEYVPSAANFLLIKVPIPGRELFRKLLPCGVVVRPVDGYGLPDYIRVSIGLEWQNRRFFNELEQILRQIGHN